MKTETFFHEDALKRSSCFGSRFEEVVGGGGVHWGDFWVTTALITDVKEIKTCLLLRGVVGWKFALTGEENRGRV